MSKKKKSIKPVTESKTVAPKESKQVGEGTYLFDPAKEQNKINDSVVRYTIFGLHEILVKGLPIVSEKSDAIYAIEEVKNNSKIFKIKLDSIGSLFNPMSVSQPSSFKTKLLGDNDYINVTADCFNHYLEFLKSKNIIHYKFAEQKRY